MKSKIFGTLTCLTLITFLATVTVAGLMEGLVAYWPLDEGEGDTTSDLSGNGNDGTLNGGPNWEDGKFGNALSFDGTDDHVDCGNPPILDFGTGDWTVSAWMRASVATEDKTIFGNGADRSGGVRYQMLLDSDNYIQCVLDDDTDKYNPRGNITVIDGEWHHIVMMRRNGTDIRLYVDGVEDTGVTNDGNSTIPADYDLSDTSQANAYIGAVWHFEEKRPEKLFAGMIDDVSIWGRALTQEEVAELAADSVPSAVEPNGKLTITWGSIKN